MGSAVKVAVLGNGYAATCQLPGLRWAEEQFRAGHDPLFHHAPVVLVLHAPPAETAEARASAASRSALSASAWLTAAVSCVSSPASFLLKMERAS